MILTAILFWYCKKDEVLTENESSLTTADYSKTPVTLDEVKQLYGNVKSGAASSREDTKETPIGVIPILELAYEDNGLVVAPIEKGLVHSNRLMGGFLKFYKDANNQVRSNLFIFMADSLAYQDPVKAIAFKRITGFILVIDDNNNMISYQERVDGVTTYSKKATIPFDDAFINTISGLNVASQRAGRKCPSAAGHGSTDTYTW